MEQSDGNGSWRFTRVVPDDLIGLGYTRLRVTSGACADPDDQAMVFEAALQPLETGDGSWGGTLEPVGLPALLLWEAAPASADARFLPAPDGVSVMVVLDGVPPGVTFTVCVGA
jgi:hypothetical protein